MILVDGTVERLYILSTYEYAVTTRGTVWNGQWNTRHLTDVSAPDSHVIGLTVVTVTRTFCPGVSQVTAGHSAWVKNVPSLVTH